MDQLQITRLGALADLLMGVAYADADLEPVEANAVERLLTAHAGLDADEDTLPAEVRRRIDDFDEATFDYRASCAVLVEAELDERVAFLRLVRDVLQADNVHDRSEEQLYFDVAAALEVANPEAVFLGID